jgi:hypothetical protein
MASLLEAGPMVQIILVLRMLDLGELGLILFTWV